MAAQLQLKQHSVPPAPTGPARAAPEANPVGGDHRCMPRQPRLLRAAGRGDVEQLPLALAESTSARIWPTSSNNTLIIDRLEIFVAM
jgi:hypothetical protein